MKLRHNDSFEGDVEHGVSFLTAQQAFLDPNRVIAEDIAHSTEANRYYCMDFIGEGILTVRFTYRGNVIRIYGAGYWRKERKSMKSKTKYTEEPRGHLKVVKDFLPPPDKLVLKEDNVKITISLKKSNINFFKEEAKTQKTSYQRMIREVADWYASHYKKSAQQKQSSRSLCSG
jgi:uncharacterized DUF497 family protein